MSNAAQLANLDNLLKIFGSFGGLASINATGTISAANVGKLVNVACASAGQTISLPAASSMPAGGLLFLVNRGTAYTLSRSGADTLSADGSVKTSFAIPTGGAVFAVSNGVDGWLVSGPGLISQQGDLAALLTGSGWQKLPSGLILRWITATTNASGIATVTLPIAFPTGIVKALITAAGTNSVATLGAVTSSTVGVNCFTGSTGAGKAENVAILAIGY